MKNRHGIKVCNNCHKPTTRRLELWEILSCSPECDQDLNDMLDNVSFKEIQARGRAVKCDIINRCSHCR